MSAKQDRQGARTPEDLERRYNFEQRFSDIMGVANDARTFAEKAGETASNPAANLTPEEVFNLLTNNGEAQGIYRGEDGQVYINASYLRSGVISSEDGAIKIDLSAGQAEPVFNTGISTNGIVIRADEANAATLFEVDAKNDNGVYRFDLKGYSPNMQTSPILNIYEDSGGLYLDFDYAGNRISIYARDGDAALSIYGQNSSAILTADDTSLLLVDRVSAKTINGKTVSWKDNGDGTYTIIGK